MAQKVVGDTLLDMVLAQCCERCLHDSGYQSGMAGAARCALIEAALADATHRPSEWRVRPDGGAECASFTPDAVESRTG